MSPVRWLRAFAVVGATALLLASSCSWQLGPYIPKGVPPPPGPPVPQVDTRDQEPLPAAQLGTWQLQDQARRVKKYVAPWYLIEFHRRFALPLPKRRG